MDEDEGCGVQGSVPGSPPHSVASSSQFLKHHGEVGLWSEAAVRRLLAQTQHTFAVTDACAVRSTTGLWELPQVGSLFRSLTTVSISPVAGGSPDHVRESEFLTAHRLHGRPGEALAQSQTLGLLSTLSRPIGICMARELRSHVGCVCNSCSAATCAFSRVP